ncbi:MAG: CBS domain-containing protein [Ruminococcaceae bacterium]|nr:CBS domain-containing protein [Oscillospiraceae bacterium]
MNVLMLLKPKSEVDYLIDKNTLKQGLDKMCANSYTAVPVLNKEGQYVGSICEGDLLKYIVSSSFDSSALNNHKISEIVRRDYNSSVTVNVSMDSLIERAADQNFIPVTDDRGFFIGIVTRKSIIEKFCVYDKTSLMQPLNAI